MRSSLKTVGRYEILDELGRGAMGVVYKARDPKIDRLVAIKTISIFAHSPEEDREFRERLFTEAKAAGRLSHAGIVTVYDVGEDPDTLNPYIVMEYVAGESLEKQVAESAERFPLSTTLALVEGVAEALDYAHSQGIVHRDIKPANILMPESGPPKITDFGIAKLNFGHPAALGEAMGTPAYMSPEQLNGEPVDGRSDLFSLGVVLYTLLTGYRPFQGNSALTISFKVVNRNPLPATAFDSEFPPDLDYVISRAMAKDPAQRYPTGREMAADVRALREAVERARGSETSSFDAVYVQGTSKVIGQLAPQPLPSAAKKLASTGRTQKLAEDWRYVSIGIVALAVVTTLVTLLLQGRSGSVPAGPVDLASAEASQQTGRGAKSKNSLPRQDLTVVKSPTQPKSSVGLSRPRKNRSNVVRATSPDVRTISTAAPARQIQVASTASATLRLRIEHRFQQAEVFVWLDDRLTYHQSVDGTVKKRMVLFKGMEGYQSDSVRVTPGEHRLRVRVHASDDSYDQTNTIAGSLPPDGERQVLIQCEKHKPLRLSMQ
jgi:eukaryotic-like serine/threonine-protein kinase